MGNLCGSERKRGALFARASAVEHQCALTLRKRQFQNVGRGFREVKYMRTSRVLGPFALCMSAAPEQKRWLALVVTVPEGAYVSVTRQ